MSADRRLQRVLSIDPTSRGFGFVVLEDGELVDWGLKDTRFGKEAATLAKVRDLLDLYRPDILAIEDCADRSSRRGRRVVDLLDKVTRVAKRLGVAVRPVSPWVAQSRLVAHGRASKHVLARVICARFPELAHCRPPERKLWMSEDERMAIFDAVALGLTANR